VVDSFGGHRFSHSMNTHECNMRFHFFDGFLDSFLIRLGRVHGHAFRASFVGQRSCPYDAFFGYSHVVPLRGSHDFSYDCTRSFPGVQECLFR
jgi:hypothetical protein